MIRRFMPVMLAAVAVSLVAGLAGTPDGRRWWSHVQYLADTPLAGRRHEIFLFAKDASQGNGDQLRPAAETLQQIR